MVYIPRTDEERFLAKVDIRDDGCWIWTGSTGGNGRYGTCWADGHLHRAHRWAYEHFGGFVIPDGYEIDHLCRVTLCVNAAHLEAVTHHENVLRGILGQKTHCPHGHPYDEQNTRVGRNGAKFCRACDRARARRSVRKCESADDIGGGL